ncbi:nucleotidyltransferase domain-containing protein [Natroniella sulfidigena]|uniref:type VII toxin-antitoxin system MntA family adenylyltransferase antitoxin n=1 Tax=Natroniella sulfidigena TaxID=723921 RepID=UPI00200ADC8E|nr:nucleotidyltransferase domain-containing protein [Natroniella sulfidigena]MCK8816313.1 nucleotidyltransferase domain-containing protein [Natroniella sulfidigena]
MFGDDLEKITDKIKSYLLENYDVKLIYLFGSILTSNFTDESDIDIAIFVEGLGFEQRIDMMSDLEGLVDRKVDLVNLTEVDVNFATEIIASGQNIYAVAQEVKEDYEMKILAKYLTLEEDRRIVIEEIYKRGSVYGKSNLKQD